MKDLFYHIMQDTPVDQQNSKAVAADQFRENSFGVCAAINLLNQKKNSHCIKHHKRCIVKQITMIGCATENMPYCKTDGQYSCGVNQIPEALTVFFCQVIPQNKYTCKGAKDTGCNRIIIQGIPITSITSTSPLKTESGICCIR